MSGLGKTIKTIADTGDTLIDGIIAGTAWGGKSITYAFPTSASSYGYDGEKDNNFAAATEVQISAYKTILDTAGGTTADNGFSIEGLTNLSVSAGDAATANIRLAQSDTANPTITARGPGQTASNGDIWFGPAYNGTDYDLRVPVAGNYAWHMMLLNVGMSVGLDVAFDAGDLPASKYSLEYSVMSYKTATSSAVNAGYQYEFNGAPQTFMMADIAALQTLYGADYSTNFGNTVYSWSPDSGDTLVNGAVGIKAAANIIFATLWDGGGMDTYDLSDYGTSVTIDLQAGSKSIFSTDQRSVLVGGDTPILASGNIYNALMNNNDSRSLIENAIGSTTGDKITGNQIANVLKGMGGADTLAGLRGADTLWGGDGADVFLYKKISDTGLGSAADTIADFHHQTGEVINLNALDAIESTSADNAFTFIGTKAFTKHAGELRFKAEVLSGDVDGDGKADFNIHVTGIDALVASDFIL